MTEEAELHINYLELLAAFLATQTFVKHRTNLYAVGQCDSSNLHQQEGGYTVSLAITASKKAVELVHGKERISSCGTHSWEEKPDSQLGITGVKGSLVLVN